MKKEEILNLVYTKEELKDLAETLKLRKQEQQPKTPEKKYNTIIEKCTYGPWGYNLETNKYQKVCAYCKRVESLSVEEYAEMTEANYSRTGR